MGKYRASTHSTYNVGYYIVFSPKYRYSLLRYRAAEKLKTLLQQSATKTWNIHSVYGSDAGSYASLHSCKTCGTSTTHHLPTERLYLVPHAERIRIPTEISVTVDAVILHGDRRTYIGKKRGKLYRKPKNKFQRPFISRLKPGRIPG